MPDETQDSGAELTVEMIDWLYARTDDTRLIITVLGKALCCLACRMKPAWMTWAQQRKAFTKALTDELKRAAAFTDTNKPH